MQEERTGRVGRTRILCALLRDGGHSTPSESRHPQPASRKHHPSIFHRIPIPRFLNETHVQAYNQILRGIALHWHWQNTQCGETVEVKGEPYVVSGVTYRYQLRRGKYEPSEKRLDVQSLGRYFVNLYYENLLDKL